jgi:transposase
MSMSASPATLTYVGVDVAKDTLAVCCFLAAKVVTVPNSSAALRAWLAGLPAGAHLICEATGRYHRLLQAECALKTVPLTCLNPARARDYARSLGRLEKTDAIDAEVLLRFGQERRPAPTAPPDEGLRQLCDLLMVRRALVAQITETGLRESLVCAQARRVLRRTQRTLRTQCVALERELEGWLASEAAAPWREKVHTLCLVTGVGVLSALSLIAYLPELGTLNRRQIAKLAGLAPLSWESGTLSGARRIQGGREPARRVLFQCAKVAARWHEPSRVHYLQLRARGKSVVGAQIAVARKLLIYLNSLLRETTAADRPQPAA